MEAMERGLDAGGWVGVGGASGQSNGGPRPLHQKSTCLYALELSALLGANLVT